ncbi:MULTISPECIES: DNA polymerase III subunit gamma/tau [unclassified Granulicatella]|uniref:DNA polymerase III subunit gamma/tau n=1 Tax=unclassified Granulicatella TaxID=2630493 RepID=UPI00107308FD|nr:MULTISPECIES: DNA polymerase III subunit gamma/tau [unclassified Granulicatella]MBF0779673.1 DNA polymerase III subunit gamma/tau [Granulicatella sp. 19428wC4_WM01]TFU96327.1 DNA polymerase III subunit gamma/tau [Granulicatella sp. WM01]
MYQALYRVWRPQKFEDIVGQNMISQTLKNAILSHKVSHAYLFTGPRGTGKTSAAKIFAKAINCPNQMNGEPCNVCDVCQSITQGTLGDVIEIDAASNNGVEEIRDIRDKSRYAPTQVQYKVYIIDEVHMLSTGAFNALLKTLEEPTQSVIFILATTEPHKIPATIISRAQRFDFKRITRQHIQERLTYILEQEQIEYDDRALQIIAKSANGGMRDALSLLDQAISYGDQGVRYEDALQVSGSISHEQMLSYVINIYEQNTSKALEDLHCVLRDGKEAGRFVEELLIFARDMLISQVVSPDGTLVDVLDSMPSISSEFIYAMIEELTLTQQALKVTTQKDIYLETFTLKMAKALDKKASNSADNALIQDLWQTVEQLKKQVEHLQKQENVQKVPIKDVPKRQNNKQFTPNLSKVFSVLAQATAKDKQLVQEEWHDIVSCLSVSQQGKLNSSVVLAASPHGIVLGFEYDVLCQMTATDTSLQQDLSQHGERLIKHPCRIECVPLSQWQTIRDKFVQSKKMGTLEQYLHPTLVEELEPQTARSSEHLEPLEEAITEIKEEIPEIISKATELFGDVVEVEE